MKNRKAIIKDFGRPSVIEITEEELPEPQFDEVRIKIEASTVSSTDIIIRKGIYPLLKQKPPFTLGYDFAGIVDKIGDDVENVRIGDKVCSIVMTGGNASYIVIKASKLTLLPKDIDTDLAACCSLSGITAYQMFIRYAEVKQGQRILIHGGSGAVGDTLIQLGKLYNCVIVASASKSKHQFIKDYGVTVIDYNEPHYFEKLQEYSGRDGYDAIFDFTNQKSFNNDIKLLKRGGTLVTYAVFSSSLKIEKKTFFNFIAFGLDFGWMMIKLLWWDKFSGRRAIFYGSSDSKLKEPKNHQDDMNALCALVITGKIKPTIFKKLPIDEVQKAHTLLQEGKVHGQIIINAEI